MEKRRETLKNLLATKSSPVNPYETMQNATNSPK